MRGGRPGRHGNSLFQDKMGQILANSAAALASIMSPVRAASIGSLHLDAEQMRMLNGLHAAPEFPTGGQQELLIERVDIDANIEILRLGTRL